MDNIIFLGCWTEIDANDLKQCPLPLATELFDFTAQLVIFDPFQESVENVIRGMPRTLQTMIVVFRLKECWTGT